MAVARGEWMRWEVGWRRMLRRMRGDVDKQSETRLPHKKFTGW
jgi:hypothetical protein